MYTRCVDATATRAGVSCLFHSGAQHLALFFSRLALLNLIEATRDSSMAHANFRTCETAVATRG